MTEPLEPLPSDIEELLAAERELPPEDSAQKQRVLRAVTLAVGAMPSGDGPGDSPGHGISGGDAATHLTSGGSAAVASATKTIVGVGIAAFLAGGFAGSALTTSMLTPEAAPAAVPTVSATATPAPSSSVIVPILPQPHASASPPASADVAPAPTTARPPAPTSSDLDRERELLDVARAALGRGNPGGALEALAKHTKQFPGAQLGEERHALMVQALVAAGRATEARSVAEKFRARYPRSMLGPVVDAASPP